MREINYIKLRIANMVDNNFNMLFILLLWILKYKTAFWILLILSILSAFVRASEENKLKEELNK